MANLCMCVSVLLSQSCLFCQDGGEKKKKRKLLPEFEPGCFQVITTENFNQRL